MNAYDMLDITVEELSKMIETKHRMSSEAWYRSEHDFTATTEGSTYEEAIEKMAIQLAQPGYYPNDVIWTVIKTVNIPVMNDDGYYELVKFTASEDGTYGHKYSSGAAIKKHPAYIKTNEDTLRAEKEKQEADKEAAKEAKRLADIAIYERIKKELNL